MKNIFLTLAMLLLFLLSSAQMNLQWQELGPDNLGASVRGLILDNRDSTRQTLYAGVMGGGVWKTTDGGNWWNYLGCTGNYAISCISQGSDGVIYIGTGDGIAVPYCTNTDEGHLGNGIYKLDSLDNFIHLDSTTAGGVGSTWGAVNRIAVNPSNPLQIIAANNGGLYKSNNRGDAWDAINISGITSNSHAYDVKWSNDGLKIFADLGLFIQETALSRSLDGGNSWEIVDSLNTGFPKTGTGRIEIALAPSSSNTAYISVGNSIGNLLGIYKTANAGNTWDTVALGRPAFEPLGEQEQYDNAISVSPADSGKIYFGGIAMYTWSQQTDVHQLPDFIYPNAQPGAYQNQFLYVINDRNPDEVYVATDKGVFKSTDAFSNFTSSQFYDHNYHLNGRDFLSVAAARNGQVMGGSQDAQGLLIGNTNNQDFINLNVGFSYCDFSHLDTNFSFMEGYYGQVYESNNQMASFFTAFDTSINPYNNQYNGPTRCGAGYNDASFFAPLMLHETKSAFATKDSVIYIAPGAETAGTLVNVTSQTAKTVFQFNLPVSLNPGDSVNVPDPIKSNLFLATSCGVWMKRHAVGLISPDWYQISNTPNYTTTGFAVTKDGNEIYYGTTNGTLECISGLNFGHYNTYNMADSFHTVTNIIKSNAPIQGIAVDPNNNSILLAAIGSYNMYGATNLYKSANAGLTWESIQLGPVGMPAYCCVIDANNSNNYIVGTEHGIWTSADSGSTWHQDDANMCDVPVYQLRQIPLLSDDCSVLYAATNSRGLWRSYTLTPSGCNTSVGLLSAVNTATNDFKIYPNPATSYTMLEFTIPKPQQVTIQVHDITGRLIQTLQQLLSDANQKIQINTSSLYAGTYLISVETSQGTKTKLLVIEE